MEGWGPYGLPSRTSSYLQDGGYTYYKTAWYYNPGLKKEMQETTNYYYRHIANKATPILAYIAYDDAPHHKGKGFGIIEHPALVKQITQANHDYNAVVSKMEIRNLIPSINNSDMEMGVAWRNSKDKDIILFSYQPFRYQADKKSEILDVTTDAEIKPESDGAFTTAAEHTYHIKRGEK